MCLLLVLLNSSQAFLGKRHILVELCERVTDVPETIRDCTSSECYDGRNEAVVWDMFTDAMCQ